MLSCPREGERGLVSDLSRLRDPKDDPSGRDGSDCLKLGPGPFSDGPPGHLQLQLPPRVWCLGPLEAAGFSGCESPGDDGMVPCWTWGRCNHPILPLQGKTWIHGCQWTFEDEHLIINLPLRIHGYNPTSSSSRTSLDSICKRDLSRPCWEILAGQLRWPPHPWYEGPLCKWNLRQVEAKIKQRSIHQRSERLQAPWLGCSWDAVSSAEYHAINNSRHHKYPWICG